MSHEDCAAVGGCPDKRACALGGCYAEKMERERRAFRDRVFLATLPPAILMQGWTTGEGKAIHTRDDRIQFAWDVADYAVRYRDVAIATLND